MSDFSSTSARAAEQADLLRRHIGVLAGEVAADQGHAAVGRFGDAEIDHLGLIDAALRQQDVGRRNIAMGLDPLVVSRGEPLGEAHEKLDHLCRRQATAIQYSRTATLRRQTP